MKNIFLLITLFLFFSCGTATILVTPKSSIQNIPELNIASNAEVGISIVSKESTYKYKAISITKAIKYKSGYTVRTLQPDNILINKYQTKDFDLFIDPLHESFGIAIPKNVGNPKFCKLNGTKVEFIIPKDKIEYKQTIALAKKMEYFKQEFLYNGRVGNGLKFIYREYINDQVRPAFTQDLQYDLSESKIIGFKGLRLEVINSTNINIEYKVLSQFNN